MFWTDELNIYKTPPIEILEQVNIASKELIQIIISRKVIANGFLFFTIIIKINLKLRITYDDWKTKYKPNSLFADFKSEENLGSRILVNDCFW